MPSLTVEDRLEKIEAILKRMSLAIVKGFAETDKKIEKTETKLKSQIDIYARAVDAYAKQAEAYIQKFRRLMKESAI